MESFQNILLLQNLYRLKALGFDYCDTFTINHTTQYPIPSNISELEQAIRSCYLCDLSKSRTQSMSGFGNPDANIMFIDHFVSSAEDENNNYFSGRSKEMLSDMITKVLNLTLDDIYLTHAIKCKPIGSNTPSEAEWLSCKNYLFAQIKLVNPKIVVALGETVYELLTGDTSGFSQTRGHICNIGIYKLIPIFHPSYLLQNPHEKQQALKDLQTIKSFL